MATGIIGNKDCAIILPTGSHNSKIDISSLDDTVMHENVSLFEDLASSLWKDFNVGMSDVLDEQPDFLCMPSLSRDSSLGMSSISRCSSFEPDNSPALPPGFYCISPTTAAAKAAAAKAAAAKAAAAKAAASTAVTLCPTSTAAGATVIGTKDNTRHESIATDKLSGTPPLKLPSNCDARRPDAHHKGTINKRNRKRTRMPVAEQKKRNCESAKRSRIKKQKELAATKHLAICLQNENRILRQKFAQLQSCFTNKAHVIDATLSCELQAILTSPH